MKQPDRNTIIAKANELVEYYNNDVLELMPQQYLLQWQAFITRGYIVVIDKVAYVQEDNIK